MNHRWKHVNDIQVSEIAFNCPNLYLKPCFVLLFIFYRISIDLDFCASLTDYSMIHLSTQCKRITSICISDCTSLTDIGILAIIENVGARLINLEISNIDLLSDGIYFPISFFSVFLYRLVQMYDFDMRVIKKLGHIRY